MGNYPRRLIDEEFEKMIHDLSKECQEMILSINGLSIAPNGTSNFHASVEEYNLSSMDEVALGDCSSVVESKSEYFSPRVEEMMQNKSQFCSTVEHEIEYLRGHWSEVSGLSNFSNENNYYEEVDRENEEVFVELMNDPQWKDHEGRGFFVKWTLWKLGRKIGEGGQAEIFEVQRMNGTIDPLVALKVFKRGSRLSDLKKQWPCGILQREVRQKLDSLVFEGTMLNDRRFAFWVGKCWGDLRKLIDQAMQKKKNRGSPFPYRWSGVTWHAIRIIRQIAFHMDKLHKQGIIHRDLKAANILLHVEDGKFAIFVADFECSIGVVGTGFWRAPEILSTLKNGSAIEFSEKVDVYSYALTCFEIVTGHLPFEGELEACRVSYDLIIEGCRPKLPSDLDVPLKVLIERCWHPIPNKRLSFFEIVEILDIITM